jgi:hypothetical protein
MIFAFFATYKICKGFPISEYIKIDFPNMPERIPPATKSFLEVVFLAGNWHIIWGLMLLSIVCHFSKVKKNQNVQCLLIALFIFFSIHYFISIISATGVQVFRAATLSRLVLQVLPIPIIIIILLNFPKIENT